MKLSLSKVEAPDYQRNYSNEAKIALMVLVFL